MRVVLILIFMLSISSSSRADQPLIIVPDVVAKEIYIEILNKSFDKPKILMAPILRAAVLFKDLKACFIGPGKNTMKEYFGIETIASDPFIKWGVGVYTATDQSKISKLGDLEGRIGAIVRGNNFTKKPLELYKLKHLIQVNNDEQIAKILNAKRADFAFYWYPRLKSQNQIHRDANFSLYETEACLVCFKKKEHRALIEKFNKKLALFKKKKWITSILEERFVYD